MGQSSQGSIESGFRFDGYKLDRFTFQTRLDTATVRLTTPPDSHEWQVYVNIRHPLYVVSEKTYVVGVEAQVALEPKDKSGDPPSEPLASLDSGITGVFSLDRRKVKREVEERLVKNQLPTILFPYLRSAVTSFLAHAGFGSFVFPLVNVLNLANEALADVEVKLID